DNYVQKKQKLTNKQEDGQEDDQEDDQENNQKSNQVQKTVQSNSASNILASLSREKQNSQKLMTDEQENYQVQRTVEEIVSNREDEHDLEVLGINYANDLANNSDFIGEGASRTMMVPPKSIIKDLTSKTSNAIIAISSSGKMTSTAYVATEVST
ncbi:15196_t:CDS:2, partial [Dentiscutata heterogama]